MFPSSSLRVVAALAGGLATLALGACADPNYVNGYGEMPNGVILSRLPETARPAPAAAPAQAYPVPVPPSTPAERARALEQPQHYAPYPPTPPSPPPAASVPYSSNAAPLSPAQRQRYDEIDRQALREQDQGMREEAIARTVVVEPAYAAYPAWYGPAYYAGPGWYGPCCWGGGGWVHGWGGRHSGWSVGYGFGW